MSDNTTALTIRNVNRETVSEIERQAQVNGMSREAYLRRVLEMIAFKDPVLAKLENLEALVISLISLSDPILPPGTTVKSRTP